MTVHTDTVTAPDFWASALINGDETGMTTTEVAAMDRYFKPYFADGWEVIDLARDDDGEHVESRFTWSYDLYGGAARGGNVVNYVILRHT